MIRNILVGLDGSDYGDAVTELALRWARQTGAKLIGFSVVDEPTIRQPQAVGIGGGSFKHERDDALVVQARKRVRRTLSEFVDRCREQSVSCRVSEETGLAWDMILHEAEDADLTLLGQHTYFQIEARCSDDGTLEHVLRRSPRPVVAVPTLLPSGRSVVVAYAGRAPASRALEVYQASGLNQGERVYVVTVGPDRAWAARQAEEGANYLRFYGIAAQGRPVATARPVAAVLLEQIKELDAGMLVMGAFGRSRFSEFFSGSITHTLLRRSNVLLFLHH